MKIKALLYCTKAKPQLYRQDDDTIKLEYQIVDGDISEYKKYYGLNNGKIVAECDYEVEEIRLTKGLYLDEDYITNTLREKEILKYSCLSYCELADYLGGKNGYAIHIKNLHIFDKPRELSDYVTKQCQFAKCSTCKYGKNNILCSTINIPITKAPQNMMYCYGKNTGEKYILISIQPEWLCKILNGEKTIEVRKVVLKEMINNE